MSKIRKNGAWVDKSLAKKRVNGAWVNADKDYYVRTPNMSGTPPFNFKSDGENLRDWTMAGQTIQSAVPSPSSPQPVSGVGERTGNLLDPTGAQSGYITADGAIVSGHANLMYTDYIAIPTNTEYITQSYDNRVTTMDSPAMCFYDSTKTYISGEAFSRATTKTFTVPSNAVYIRTCYRTIASWNMLNTGSTAQPYEPYGYKIPVNVQSGNLWNEVFPEQSENRNKYIPIYVGNGDFTFSTNGGLYNSQYAMYMFMAGRVSSGGSSASNGVSVGHPRTVTAIDGYVTIVYHGYSGDYYPENFWGMLNRGSTPLPYQPYSNTTTNIYLGTAASTRRVKKLVLTGEETDWTLYQLPSGGTVGIYQFYINDNIITGVANSSCRCTITPYGITAQNRGNYPYGAYLVSSGRSVALQMKGSEADFATVDAFKTYLQQQYAAGTPVTIWYVLATAETAATNEPLMKIGTYADELTKTGTGVNISTVSGSNTLAVNTTVQPSGMSIQSISQWV